MPPVPLHIILFSFLEYTQKRTEKILSNINQQNHGTTLTNITNRSATANQGRCEKTNF